MVLVVAAGAFWLTYVVAKAWLDEALAWIDGHLQFALSRDVTEAIRQAGAVSVAASIGGWLLLQGFRRIKVAEAEFAPARTGDASPAVESAQRRTIPRQLPSAPQRFAGRSAELAMLTDALDHATRAGMTVVISAIGGAGGIGKTSLALRWARQHLDRFPDGQLLVDLRGFAPTGEPMSVAEAVRGFLYALGEDPTKLPPDLDTQIGLYRSLVEDRRMLIVLDNARDPAQVVPLLPGGPGCTVLITSRRRLAGLATQHGAQLVDLAPLSEPEARQLLANHLGEERLRAEPEAVAVLLAMCGGLPLALSIVAARVIAHPALPLSGLADELADLRTRLEGFDAGEIPLHLESVFSWSYQALTDPAAEMFGLIGLAPGPDIGLAAAAELAGLPPARARLLLRELETAHLVEQQVAGRYRMHDLLRLYATKQAREHLSDSNREEALRRVIDFYRHTAHRAERLLDPHRHPVGIDAPAPGCHPLPLADPAEAVAWLEAEHANLMAAQQLAAELGMHDLAWQLAWCMDTFHYRRGHLREWRAVWQTGLESARQVGDPAVISLAHRLLGDANLNLDDHEEALAQLTRSLQVAQDAGDLSAQAHAHRILTWANGRAGKDQAAHRHATKALQLYRELGLRVREAAMLNAVGWFEARLGDYAQAQAHCEAALALCRQHDYRVGEANTLASLGYVAQHTGRPDDALTHYHAALALFRGLNSVYYQANALDRLGQVHAAAGRADQAREVWAQAIRLYRGKGRPVDADRVQKQLDDLG
ncbi:ATP-binding protein [Micromonospora sp. NPDC049051]|uniref:ATP-binding protein n=1 Tax=Micromonospora sp. NPDC049051 TaxID=3364264 RepID=UPI003713DF2B